MAQYQVTAAQLAQLQAQGIPVRVISQGGSPTQSQGQAPFMTPQQLAALAQNSWRAFQQPGVASLLGLGGSALTALGQPQAGGAAQAAGGAYGLGQQAFNPQTLSNLSGINGMGAGWGTGLGLASGAAGLAGGVYGLAGGDPAVANLISAGGNLAGAAGSIASGATASALSGASAGSLAAVSAGLAPMAGLMAAYAIGTTLGAMKSADIEKHYAKRAGRQFQAFMADEDVKNVTQYTQRLLSGDTSVIPHLARVMNLTQETLALLKLPESGTGKATQAVWDTLNSSLGPVSKTSQYTPLLKEYTKDKNPRQFDPSFHQALNIVPVNMNDPYQFASSTFGTPLPAPPGFTPPPLPPPLPAAQGPGGVVQQPWNDMWSKMRPQAPPVAAPVQVGPGMWSSPTQQTGFHP